jgi:excisionase family DNA binding protein
MTDTEQAASSVPKVLLTVEEAAQALGLGRTYVWHLVMLNQLRSFKVGRKRRVPVSALQEFVMQQLATLELGA